MPDDNDRNEPLGPRRAALEQRRRTRRKKRTLFGTILTVLAIGAAAAVVVFAAREVVRRDDPAPQAVESPPVPPATTLVMGERGSGELAWLSLLTSDRERQRVSVAYLPAHTAVEVPGRGLRGLHEAFRSGGPDLTVVSIENLLGITIERFVVLGTDEMSRIVSTFEPLTVDVPSEVRVSAGRGQTRLLLSEGEQQMDASDVVRLLFTLGVDGDDLALGPRNLAFWDALTTVVRSDPEAFTSNISSAEDAFRDSDAEASELIAAIAGLGTVPSEATKFRSLPVTSLEVPGSPLYVPHAEEVADFVESMIGDVGVDGLVRVQILNGNGRPGVGQAVADLLVGEGFRVMLSGNAPRLNYRETLIVAYRSGEGVTAAERAKALLGVGEVQVSTQDQGIVDITIIVGKDFLRKR